jgi:hypothetical protein
MANKKADVKLSETAGSGEAIVGSASDHAIYVNNGTRYQASQPFLTTAGEIVARKLSATITQEQQKAMYKEISSKFTRSIKDGVTTIKYGNPLDGVEAGNKQSLLSAAVGVTAQAKALSPVDEGELRNSIMWKTEDSEGGFNEG